MYGRGMGVPGGDPAVLDSVGVCGCGGGVDDVVAWEAREGVLPAGTALRVGPRGDAGTNQPPACDVGSVDNDPAVTGDGMAVAASGVSTTDPDGSSSGVDAASRACNRGLSTGMGVAGSAVCGGNAICGTKPEARAVGGPRRSTTGDMAGPGADTRNCTITHPTNTTAAAQASTPQFTVAADAITSRGEWHSTAVTATATRTSCMGSGGTLPPVPSSIKQPAQALLVLYAAKASERPTVYQPRQPSLLGASARFGRHQAVSIAVVCVGVSVAAAREQQRLQRPKCTASGCFPPALPQPGLLAVTVGCVTRLLCLCWPSCRVQWSRTRSTMTQSFEATALWMTSSSGPQHGW